jgi:transposase-like protein
VAKQRLEVILETIADRLTVSDACRQLGIGESRFHQRRNQTLQATLEALEPRPLGRPAKPTSPEETEIDTLQAELRRLQADLELAQVQLRLARIHPGLVGGQPAADDLAEKKNTRNACQH